MHERWLSEGEIALQQGVNADTIFKWIDRKKISAHKLGPLCKLLASKVDPWIKGSHAAGDAAATRRKLARHWTAFP